MSQLCSMKRVGQGALALAFLGLMCIGMDSCGRLEEDLPGDLGEDERPAGGGEEKKDPVIYVTGIGFPSGYDWRKGNYADVETYLIVLKNGEKYLNLPVGDKYHLSPDPDMHRLIGGNLYSDYSTEEETIVSKNGSEIFRYPGREMMMGFLVRDKEIYTLGMSRSGKGISYRCNGKLLFEDVDGTIVESPGGSLYEDGGDIGFTYRKKRSSTDLGSWYVYAHGRAEKIELGSDISRLYAVRQVGGKLCAVVSYEENPLFPMLLWGEEPVPISNSANFNGITHCEILPSGEQVYVKSVFAKGMAGRTVLWSNTEKRYLYDGTLPVYDFYMEGEDCRFLVVSHNNVFVYDTAGGREQIRGYYQVTSPGCASLDEGVMRVALSPCDYLEHPVLWTDGEMSELPFTGYVTSVVSDYGRR